MNNQLSNQSYEHDSDSEINIDYSRLAAQVDEQEELIRSASSGLATPITPQFDLPDSHQGFAGTAARFYTNTKIDNKPTMLSSKHSNSHQSTKSEVCKEEEKPPEDIRNNKELMYLSKKFNLIPIIENEMQNKKSDEGGIQNSKVSLESKFVQKKNLTQSQSVGHNKNEYFMSSTIKKLKNKSQKQQSQVIIRAIEDSFEFPPQSQQKQFGKKTKIALQNVIVNHPGNPSVIQSSQQSIKFQDKRQNKIKTSTSQKRTQSKPHQKTNQALLLKVKSLELLIQSYNLENQKNKPQSQSAHSNSQLKSELISLKERIRCLQERSEKSSSKTSLQCSPRTQKIVKEKLSDKLAFNIPLKIPLKKAQSKFFQSQPNKQKKPHQNPSMSILQEDAMCVNFDESNIFSISFSDLTIPQMKELLNNKIWLELHKLPLMPIKNIEIRLKQILLTLKITKNPKIISINPHIVASLIDESSIKIIIKNSTLYIGETAVHSHHKQGKGLQLELNKYLFVGNFSKNKIQKYGKIVYMGDSWYQGQWKHGKYEGKGKQLSKSNNFYQGDFVNGKKSGKGVEIFNNGDKYQGQYLENSFHNKGIYKWKNKSIYSGEFLSNKMHGKGYWRSYNGDQYEGEYKDNQKNGYGVYKWANGKVFEGYFINGNRAKGVERSEPEDTNEPVQAYRIFFNK